eukprot:TRINITY_DN31268_c0_g1_i1.p1 TRINITY_DN31268_c0_g1~~TRINITY_DN31268_c0_g1_i1.p1  ORF type:complete len:212 (+),score=31.21 TRINITY_DN31268_c0_g1_i1:125-760(+)
MTPESRRLGLVCVLVVVTAGIRIAEDSKDGALTTSGKAAQANKQRALVGQSEKVVQGASAARDHALLVEALHQLAVASSPVDGHLLAGLHKSEREGCLLSDDGENLGCKMLSRCACTVLETCYPHYANRTGFGGTGLGDVGVCSFNLLVLIFLSCAAILGSFLLMICLRRSAVAGQCCCFTWNTTPPIEQIKGGPRVSRLRRPELLPERVS